MSYFRYHYKVLNTYRTGMFVFALMSVLSPLAVIALLQEDKKVVIMDAAGNYHLVTGSAFDEAKALHQSCVKAAITSLFTRTPAGYAYPDILRQAFARPCDDWITTYTRDTREEFELKKMRQIPEIQKMQILSQGDGKYIANAKVYLTRACEYAGTRYVETAIALVSFAMIENPDISANRRLPLTVVQIIGLELKIEGQKDEN